MVLNITKSQTRRLFFIWWLLQGKHQITLNWPTHVLVICHCHSCKSTSWYSFCEYKRRHDHLSYSWRKGTTLTTHVNSAQQFHIPWMLKLQTTLSRKNTQDLLKWDINALQNKFHRNNALFICIKVMKSLPTNLLALLHQNKLDHNLSTCINPQSISIDPLHKVSCKVVLELIPMDTSIIAHNSSRIYLMGYQANVLRCLHLSSDT